MDSCTLGAEPTNAEISKTEIELVQFARPEVRNTPSGEKAFQRDLFSVSVYNNDVEKWPDLPLRKFVIQS